MQKREETNNVIDESASSAAEVANTANRAMRDTAQKYLDMAGMKVDLGDIEQRLRDRALFSLGLAMGIGFILGGGLATKPGVMLLGLFGRSAVRQTAKNVGEQVLQKASSRA
ncbi:MAG: hypothetical protein JO189_09770 [Deltaproteobacteria bacterium]|nr:hypothetical protein [Deltaproteobacteria bacterium]